MVFMDFLNKKCDKKYLQNMQYLQDVINILVLFLMIKGRHRFFTEKEESLHNEFLPQVSLTLEKEDNKGRMSLKNTVEKQKMLKERKNYRKEVIARKLKMGCNERNSFMNRALPQLILKTPLGFMNHGEFKRSEKLLKNSEQNANILNGLIEILQQDDTPQERLKSIKINNIKQKSIKTQGSTINEFLEEKESVKISPIHRGPKIIQKGIMKFMEHSSIEKRNIFSEERTRPVLKKYSASNSNSNSKAMGNNTEQLLTFYNFKQCNKTQAIKPIRIAEEPSEFFF